MHALDEDLGTPNIDKLTQDDLDAINQAFETTVGDAV